MTDRSLLATPWVEIGLDETELRSRAASGIDEIESLAMGARRTSTACFKHDPPTPLELEQAIDAIEDELMRVRRAPSGSSRLATRDPAIAALADAAGVAPAQDRELSLELVESLFQRLVFASLAQRGAARDLPVGPEAAATLLILRELMHHRGFKAISVLPAGPSSG